MKLKESDETNNPCQQERNRNMQQKMVHFNSELIMHCEKEAGRAGKGFFFPFFFLLFLFLFIMCIVSLREMLLLLHYLSFYSLMFCCILIKY